jgi:hypothetical protein
VNQQHSIRLQLHRLPLEIADTRRGLANITADIVTRDAHDGEEFVMTVGCRQYSGKGAREEAAKALTHAILSWRDDTTLQPRGVFRGFEILSKGKSTVRLNPEDDRLPEIFIRGKGTYTAHLNPENPIGTVQSIEHTLRALDRAAGEEQQRMEHLEKTLSDYQAQANRPFEHEVRLKELLGRQTQLNAALDLDKGERQIAEAAHDRSETTKRTDAVGLSVSSRNRSQGITGSTGRAAVARDAAEYMRRSKSAIADLAITERTVPQIGLLNGTAIAQNDTHLAIATAPNSFVVLEREASKNSVELGARVHVRFRRGRGTVEAGGRVRGQ